MNEAVHAAKEAGLSRVEWAYREIKQRILNNQYPPGYQALEKELAEDLGISRTPLRESLRQLELEGLIRVIPRHGFRVVPLSADDMREIYEVLACLEVTAAQKLAASKPGEAKLKPLKDALDAMDKALEQEDRQAWAKADEQFHRCLLENCGNKRLSQIAYTMRDQSHRARLVSLNLRPLPWKSNQEHRKLYEAILAGDPQAARQVHESHRSKTSEMITDILSNLKLSGL